MLSALAAELEALDVVVLLVEPILRLALQLLVADLWRAARGRGTAERL